MRPSRTAASAMKLSSLALTYHWSVRNGSIGTPPRSPCGTMWVCGSILSSRPAASSALDDLLARDEAVEPMQRERFGQIVGRLRKASRNAAFS